MAEIETSRIHAEATYDELKRMLLGSTILRGSATIRRVKEEAEIRIDEYKALVDECESELEMQGVDNGN